MDDHSATCRAVHFLDGLPGSVTAALEHTRDFLDRCSPGLPEPTTDIDFVDTPLPA